MSLALPALALLLAAAPPPAAPPPPAGPATPVILHGSVGTGVCAAPKAGPGSTQAEVENPCWLQIGIAPAIQVGAIELGVIYEGRDVLKLVTFLQLQPPSVSVLGGTAGIVVDADERWRLLAAGELGWRRYADFSGEGLTDREGAASTLYAGVTGRAAYGLKPRSGRTDRLEVSVSIRRDLTTGKDTVGGVPWEVSGWSFVMGIGLVAAW